MIAVRVFILLLLASSAFAGEAPYVPDDALTPGVVRHDLTLHQIITTKWGTDRRFVTKEMKDRVFAAYGLTRDDPSCEPDAHGRRFEIDHRVPRSLAGADAVLNLWPQCYTGKWNAVMKDHVELRAGRDLKQHLMTLAAAQGIFLRDWRETYTLYFGKPIGD